MAGGERGGLSSACTLRRIAALGLAAGALALAAHEISELAEASGGGQAPKVLAATTGNHSETLRTVPITRGTAAKPHVVMSMGPHKLPGIAAGDRLKLSAELQVTVNCFRSDPACVGPPYFFNPHVGSKLVLAAGPRIARGEHAKAITGRRVITCKAKPLRDRQHHCVLVFKHASLPIANPSSLPCRPGGCYVNFVVDAHNRRAHRGDQLIIGANKPNGHILQDKGRINAVRLRPGNQPPPPVLKTGRRRHTRVPLDQTPTVVLSQRLGGMRKGTQLAVFARMRADASGLPYSARVTTHLILARTPHATTTSNSVARMATLHGELAETNGSNCTRTQSPCPYAKVGVLRMVRDARSRHGLPIPLFVNLYVVSNPKRAQAHRQRSLRILPDAQMRIARYRPSLLG
jgi:hypothetical protein